MRFDVIEDVNVKLHMPSVRQNQNVGDAKGTCIKVLFLPPLEQKTESCFSPISYYWLVRRIAQV